MASLARSSCSLCRVSAPSLKTQGVQVPRQLLARYASSATDASTSASESQDEASTSSSSIEAESTSSSPVHPPISADPKTRIVAAMILSRPPRTSIPLSNFEKEYFKYARKINRALGDRFNPDWFFRKGSQAEQAYKDMMEDVKEGKELQGYPIAAETSETSPTAAEEKDVHNLERRKDRTLYFLAKKDRKQHTWQFPQGGVEKGETLSKASIRELLEEFGSDLDVWQTGKIPAAVHSYDLPKPTDEGQTNTKVFYMPARVMRGKPQPNKQEGLVDYAWCTREEVEEKLQDDTFWKAVKPVLSY